MIFKNSRNKLRAEKFVGLFVLVLASLLFVYWQVNKINDKLKENILDTQIVGINDFAKNAENLFLENFSNENIDQIFDNEKALNMIEDSLEILNSRNYKYIYIVYKNKRDGKYRFLIDSALKDKDKEKRNAPLPVGDEMSIYDETIKGTKHRLLFHENSENVYNLFVTYIKPIKISENEVALFSLDFSVDLEHIVKDIVGKIKNSIIFLIFLLSLVLIGLLILVIKAIIDQDKAFLDDLTNTYNRKYLNYLDKREKLGEDYSAMLLDIDHFKRVNDTYGHQIGDYVLINVVSAIKSCVNANDVLIRYGGEEFLLLVKNREKHICESIAQRILRSVENNTTITDKFKIKTTVSIGISICEEDRSDIFEMIKHADEALYYSKEHGRNQANFYTCEDE